MEERKRSLERRQLTWKRNSIAMWHFPKIQRCFQKFGKRVLVGMGVGRVVGMLMAAF